MHIFLDVDGVIAPWEPIDTRTSLDDEHVDFRLCLAGFNDAHLISVGPHTRDWVQRIAHHIVWATTWCLCVEDTIVPTFGLPPGLPNVGYDRLSATPQWGSCGKRLAIDSWRTAGAHEHTPFIWIDDDLGWRDRSWAKSTGVAHLLVRPRPNSGIEQSHIGAIDAFIKLHGG